jgi:hypothetical protein
LNALSIKTAMTFFTGEEQNPKIHMEAWNMQNDQNNPKQKNYSSGIKIPDGYYTA